mmetsp:Transcript_63428/g.116874  ORF Transcript_63428/g.116874 Transcript_63428/m.116874 type:complete len:237 (+) Transcript_63428:1405-2115(+)
MSLQSSRRSSLQSRRCPLHSRSAPWCYNTRSALAGSFPQSVGTRSRHRSPRSGRWANRASPFGRAHALAWPQQVGGRSRCRRPRKDLHGPPGCGTARGSRCRTCKPHLCTGWLGGPLPCTATRCFGSRRCALLSRSRLHGTLLRQLRQRISELGTGLRVTGSPLCLCQSRFLQVGELCVISLLRLLCLPYLLLLLLAVIVIALFLAIVLDLDESCERLLRRLHPSFNLRLSFGLMR